MLAALSLAACEGPAGPPGPPGPPTQPGSSGDAGPGAHPGAAAREGLSLAFERVVVANDGTVTAFFTLADAKGIPLDRTGAQSAGEVSTSFTLAKLDDPHGAIAPGEYTAITSRTATTPDGGNPQPQATSESAGTYTELAPGKYAYQFVAKIPAPVAGTDVFAAGASATRTYNALRYVANAVIPFDGTSASPAPRRDVVATETCNTCHGVLQAHGGSRRDVALCILCHNAWTLDPDTGNTADMPVMVHKIHMGRDLPSVRDGGTYQIIGFRQSVHDYSTVAMPPPNAPNNCPVCHVPGAAAQADVWNRLPALKVCGSCHDRTWFGNPAAIPEGWSGHTGGGQQNDSACQTCHTPDNITNNHLVGYFAPNPPQSELTIQSVTNAAPGQSPVVTFRVRLDGGTYDILNQGPLARIAVTYAGPTQPYTRGVNSYVNKIVQSRQADGGYTSDGTLAATGTPGVFTIDLGTKAGNAIPAEANGTWYFALEGYLRSSPQPRFATNNVIVPVAVTGSTAMPKRRTVDTAQCNACHLKLGAHGGSRVNAEYCVLCHHPLNLNDDRAAHVESADIFVNTTDSKVMIHKIHMGERLTQQPYVLGGNPSPTRSNPAGTPIDFGEVRYPNDPIRCDACHVTAGNTLPFGEGIAPTATATYTCNEDPSVDPDAYCEPGYFVPEQSFSTPPESAACTSCHDSSFAIAHAATMTSAGLEACATCHGPGAAYDVTVVHAPRP